MLTVDLNTQTVKRNKTILIQNGVPVGNYNIDTAPVTFDRLELLYEQYKHSVPNGVKYKCSYFKALCADDLTTDELTNGANRQTAKEQLELTLIAGILNGSLVWPDDTKWFWQSEKDKDFVLLRDWFKKGSVICE